jgi:hypothetical protein
VTHLAATSPVRLQLLMHQVAQRYSHFGIAPLSKWPPADIADHAVIEVPHIAGSRVPRIYLEDMYLGLNEEVIGGTSVNSSRRVIARPTGVA